MSDTILEFQPINEFGEVCDKIGVDLQWVMAARSWRDDATQIALAGSRDWIVIFVAYPEFMRMWMEARRK